MWNCICRYLYVSGNTWTCVCASYRWPRRHTMVTQLWHLLIICAFTFMFYLNLQLLWIKRKYSVGFKSWFCLWKFKQGIKGGLIAHTHQETFKTCKAYLWVTLQEHWRMGVSKWGRVAKGCVWLFARVYQMIVASPARWHTYHHQDPPPYNRVV